MNVLVTGGLGYIGSHLSILLAEAGCNVLIVDNLSNSQFEIFSKIQYISKKEVNFSKLDIRDTNSLSQFLSKNKIDSVIHCAGLKSVGESVKNPIKYYDNNINGTISLINAMNENNIKKLIFSSSATVYGEPNYLPIDEGHSTNQLNPYGFSKLTIENILKDLTLSDKEWRIIILRYFNPVGAHESGLIGELPLHPTNLMPIISMVAANKLKKLLVYGDDYPTEDGTCIRDFIHVMDLAEGHELALKQLNKSKKQFDIFNLGTGSGVSVLEMIRKFHEITGVEIPYEFSERRPGDVTSSYACSKKAQKYLKWKPKRDLNTMCSSAWAWQNYYDKNN